MLRYFGHRAVCVLDGGMAAWKAAGGQTEKSAATPKAGDFSAAAPYKAGLISFDELCRDVENSTADQIIDARASERFNGLAPEPRAGLRSGHIPGSLNLPIGSLLDGSGKLKSVEDLQKLFDEAGFDMSVQALLPAARG